MPLRVVLSHTSHPGNIGAAARAMKTMGFDDLVLVAPRHFPDPDATAMAAGAADVLQAARVVDTLEAAIAECTLAVGFSARGRDLSHAPAALRGLAPEILATAEAGTVALVFGNETSGLSNEELLRCQRLAHIPANPAYSSLNLAAAVQVFAYELRMAAGEPLGPEPPAVLATHEDIEGFYAHLEQVMCESGFMNPEHPRRLMPRLRRLFARTGLEPEEVNILRGILKALTRPSGK